MNIPIVMPQLGLTMEEGTISGWLKKTGEPVKKDELLFSISTDKVEMDVESSAEGTLGDIVVVAGETVRVGTVIAYLVCTGENVPVVEAADAKAVEKISSTTESPGQTTLAPTRREEKLDPSLVCQQAISPRARRLANELGIDISRVPSGEPDGQITELDIRKFVAPRDKASAADSGRRQLIAQRLTRSIQTIPTLSVAAEVNAENLLNLHESLRDSFAKTAGTKLTITDLLLSVFATVLKSSPEINAIWESEAVRTLTSVDIGLAVATTKGVVAPVIRNLDAMDLAGLVARRTELVEKTRTGRASLGDLQGGVGTLSNLGMYRVDHFQALISPGQSSILAIGQIRNRPWVEESLTIKPTIMLNLTVDHRVADGAAAAVFLGKIIQLIEEPRDLSLKSNASSGNGARS